MLPELLSIGDLIIYAYPLFLGLAWGAGYAHILHQIQKYKLEQTGIHGFLIGVFIAAWVGAKLFFLLFSYRVPELLMYSSFWLGGGFVFYGGLIFGMLFSFVYCVILKKHPYRNLVYYIPSVCYGHAIGRVGCFLAGCCFGNKCDLPFLRTLHIYNHPVQLYEAAGLLFIGKYIAVYLEKSRQIVDGVTIYLIGYSLLRFILEFLRGDTIRGNYGIFSSSQWVSIFIMITVLSWKFLHGRKKSTLE